MCSCHFLLKLKKHTLPYDREIPLSIKYVFKKYIYVPKNIYKIIHSKCIHYGQELGKKPTTGYLTVNIFMHLNIMIS